MGERIKKGIPANKPEERRHKTKEKLNAIRKHGIMPGLEQIHIQATEEFV